MEIKIRKLIYKDRLKLSGMIKKLADVTGDETILNAISSESTKGSGETNDNAVIKTGIHIVKTLIEYLESETQEWFAELIGVTKERFLDEAPFDVETQILTQLSEAKEVKSFFTGASQLYNLIQKFRNKSEDGKEK